MGRFDLTCPEDTPAGMFLGRLYYDTRATDLFTTNERSGFPNDGGRHTLYLRMSAGDAHAFIDLIEERYGNMRGAAEFIKFARAQVS